MVNVLVVAQGLNRKPLNKASNQSGFFVYLKTYWVMWYNGGMKTKTFSSLKEAISSVLVRDTEFRILTHRLTKWKRIKNHHHPDTSEWVIFNEGDINFFYKNEWLKIKPGKGKVIVVSIPPKIVHGLVAVSPTHYLVIRDKEVETIYED